MIRSVSNRYRWLVPIVFVAAVILTVVLGTGAGSTAGAAGDDTNPELGNHIHAADLDGAGRFTGPGEVWPPRPDGAGPAALVPEATLISGDSIPAEGQVAAIAAAAELGDNWNMTDMQVGLTDGKGNTNPTAAQVEFFSLSNNQTVTVTMDSGAATAVEVTAATEYQPVISNAEKIQAVQIARDHFVAQGVDRINELNGYAIRAFDSDRGYYDTRMIYISFHEDEGFLPEFVANVDLTTGTIDMARAES